ncbi:MAG TPA: MarR family winged helix-turn-helix transcriptional regulator [Casimicrobium sp.]|nr:MarR family winged helix-turn-helix transcriptional regulator [Casimicrobium sp.]
MSAARARRTATLPSAAAADGGDAASNDASVDASFLESLLGYNARRAALTIIEVFLEHMSVYGLRPVDFSLLSLVAHNPGITSRQLCAALGILPPNLVRLVADLDKRGLIVRKPHPTDGRAIGLHLAPEGKKMMREAEAAALALEDSVASELSLAERQTLMQLLQKIYKPKRATP